MITAKKLRQKARYIQSDDNFKYILARLKECDATKENLKIPLSDLPQAFSELDLDSYCHQLSNLGFYLPDCTAYGIFKRSVNYLLISWED